MMPMCITCEFHAKQTIKT